MTAPIDAKTEKAICSLRRDNFPPRDDDVWSILLSVGSVSLHSPPGSTAGYVTIPRKDFDAIVRWYLRDQPTNPPKKARRGE